MMKLLSLGLRAEKNFSKPQPSNSSGSPGSAGLATLAATSVSLKDIADIKEKLEQVCRTLTLAKKEPGKPDEQNGQDEKNGLNGLEGFLLKVDEVQKNNYIFLECHVKEGELSFKNYERLKKFLIDSVSDIVAGLIVDRQERKIARKILNSDHIYLSSCESEILINNILAALNSSSPQNSEFSAGFRKEIIREELLEYLHSHHELVLEGFICFRLKDYRQKLEQVIDSVVADFLMEQEYKEFLRVLKYFVDIQPARVEEIHVIIEGNGAFKVPDADENLINIQYLNNIVTYCFNKSELEFKPNPSEINYEDALISVLITVAPNNIMIHSNNLSRDQEIIETVKSIFSGRVIICNSCEICKFENEFETTVNTLP